MLSACMDYKRSLRQKITGDDKIDPGSYSFMQPGWWVLHFSMIAAVYILGMHMGQRKR